ncbi:MAG: FAD-dependent oxidoreductase, partial [Caldiserica bacterium]|nr:FAD-dependent oxidoreductase [Caldisericota bacterium]
MSERTTDILIIGAGPAGLAAALYASRSLVKPVVLERMSVGGLVLSTEWIDNYPGFPDGIAAPELMDRMRRQAERFGAEFVSDEALSLNRTDVGFNVTTGGGTVYQAGSVIVATGAMPRILPVKEESKYRGRGISYCAACDAAFFKGKPVAVVGGGGSAVEEALVLARGCSKVIVVFPLDSLQAEPILVEQLSVLSNVEFVPGAAPAAVEGEGKVERLRLRLLAGGEKTLEVSGVFVAMEFVPTGDLLKGLVEVDAQGYVVAPESTETGIAGLYIAGDVRRKSLRQIVTAVADGAVAAQRAGTYVRSKKGNRNGTPEN